MIYTNNTTYEGQWNKNFANGNGTFVTRDGIIYSGTFKEGKINYSGSVTYATNQDYTQKGELFYRHGIDMESISLLRGEYLKNRKIFEVVGLLSVIGSLLFVGIEINQNTTACLLYTSPSPRD